MLGVHLRKITGTSQNQRTSYIIHNIDISIYAACKCRLGWCRMSVKHSVNIFLSWKWRTEVQLTADRAFLIGSLMSSFFNLQWMDRQHWYYALMVCMVYGRVWTCMDSIRSIRSARWFGQGLREIWCVFIVSQFLGMMDHCMGGKLDEVGGSW